VSSQERIILKNFLHDKNRLDIENNERYIDESSTKGRERRQNFLLPGSIGSCCGAGLLGRRLLSAATTTRF